MKYLFQCDHVRLSNMDKKLELNIYHAHYFMTLYKFNVNINSKKDFILSFMFIKIHAMFYTIQTKCIS